MEEPTDLNKDSQKEAKLVSNDNEAGNTVVALESEQSPTNAKTEKNLNTLKYKKFILIALLLVVVIVTIIIIVIAVNDLSNSNQEKNENNENYGCLTDSGSTSSRVIVYKWPISNTEPLPNITEITKRDFLPPLAQLETDEEVENYTNSLLSFCQTQINNLSNNTANINNVPFILKATAGMRSISIEKQEKIIKVVRDTIKKSSLLFPEDQNAEVITGQDEGLYGWITTNYLSNILSENEKEKQIVKEPYGVMDLGGSSMEFAFKKEENNITANQIKINLKSIEYTLYSVVFDHYGQNDMYSNIFNYLINKTNDNETVIEHPCLLKNYSENYTYNNIEYNFYGTGNFNECHSLVKENINKSECQYEHCSINGEYQPVLVNSQNFYAISGFAYAAAFFGLDGKNYYSANDILNNTEKYCDLSIDEAKKKYNVTDLSYVKMYCYTGNYIYNVLVDGFGFGEDWKNIMFTNKINGKNSGSWAIGAMLKELLEIK